ncbi:MAG: lysophospholipid acyltransferase family protein [Polyangiaceae bacterium]
MATEDPAASERRRLDLRVDSSFWRRAMRGGAVYGPGPFVRFSPPLFGAAFAAAMPRVRARVRENVRRARGRASLADVLGVFANYACSLTEAFAVGSGRNERLVAEVSGDDVYRRARAVGRGVIVVTAHTSGWYAAGPILRSVYDDPVLVVMQHERDADAESIQGRTRRALGVEVAYVGDDPLAALPLLSHLKKGGVVAIQIDRLPSRSRGLGVPFLGGTMEMPTGPLQLAALSGAPIISVLGRRAGFLDYVIEVTGGWTLPRRAEPDVVAGVARDIARVVERFVRAHPTHWFHFA